MDHSPKFIAGQTVRVTSDASKIREELVGILGMSGTVVDTLDHVVLIQLIDDEEAFMIREDELSPWKDPKGWEIGETVRIMHDYDETEGTIITPHLVLNGEVNYGIEVEDGHIIVPVKNFLS